jgi:hypothetical protein
MKLRLSILAVCEANRIGPLKYRSRRNWAEKRCGLQGSRLQRQLSDSFARAEAGRGWNDAGNAMGPVVLFDDGGLAHARRSRRICSAL